MMQSSNGLNGFFGNRRRLVFVFALIFAVIFLSVVFSRRGDDSLTDKDRETNKYEYTDTPTRSNHDQNDDMSAVDVYSKNKDSIVFISVRRTGTVQGSDEPLEAVGATGIFFQIFFFFFFC